MKTDTNIIYFMWNTVFFHQFTHYFPWSVCSIINSLNKLNFHCKIINKPPAQFVYKVPFWTASVNKTLFFYLYENNSTPIFIKKYIFVRKFPLPLK